MNPRTSLTILGILLLILGIYPLAVKAIPSLETFPVEAGSVVYQSIIIFVGILALFFSAKPRERSMPQYIIQK
jgi:K+-transporting ATPase c subunit